MLIEIILLISKSINNLLPLTFNGWFPFCSVIDNYKTASSATDKIFKPSDRSDPSEKNLITVSSKSCCKETQHQFSSLLLKTNNSTIIKSLLNKKSIDKY